MGPIAQKSRWTPLREAVDCKLKQKDLREKLRSKSLNCRADKTKLLERWKEKKGGDTGSFGNKEKEQEMLIAKMRSEDKEEASKLLLRLKEEVESQKPLIVFHGGGREEVFQKESMLKEEDGDSRLHHEKSKNPLRKRLTEVSSCSIEEYFKRRKEGMIAQRTDDKTGKHDKLKHCDASDQGTDVKRVQRFMKVENSEKTEKKRKRKCETKEYTRSKEERVTKKVHKEVVTEILSEKGWREKPHRRDGKEAYKEFKKLFKKKVDEKLAQCQSEGESGATKMGDINDNVEKSSSGKEEKMRIEEWDMKEVPDEEEPRKLAESDYLENAALSEEGCVKENHDAEGLHDMEADAGGEAAAVMMEEVVSEDDSTEEEGGLVDISEDLRAEEEDPGYIKWKLAYLEAKLKELEEKEVVGTSISKDCNERGTTEMRLGRVWICEESSDDSKDVQIQRGDMSEADAQGSSQGVEEIELEEGEIIEAEACEEAFVESKEEERIFKCSSITLPSGFLEAVVKACTKEVPTCSSEPIRSRVSKLVNKKVPGVKVNCKKSVGQIVAVKTVLEEVSEPDPSALEHLDLRPPQSSHPPFTMMMHQQVVSALTDVGFKKRSLEGFDITRHDLCSLTGLRWLNDQVIQVYLSLVVERSKCPTFKELQMPKVLAMSTFIYQNIMRKSRGHAAVASWTSNINLFENDLVLFPMHIDLSHWVLAVADFRSKTITSYDSMGSTHQASLEAIRAYLDSEHKATKGSNLKGFWMCQAGDCPQQENTADCGVFLCRIAESLTRGGGSGTFTQADMPYLRRRCLFEIVRGKLL